MIKHIPKNGMKYKDIRIIGILYKNFNKILFSIIQLSLIRISYLLFNSNFSLPPIYGLNGSGILMLPSF